MPLFNIIISSIVTELLPQEKKGKEYYKNNREVMFLLDEFTNFGRIDVVEETITFTRSFGIKYVLVIQDSNQINKTYDINSSFWSNCKIKCFFNLDDDINNIMEQNKLELNASLPAYSHLSEIRIQPKEFEKTPKKSIKRYLYQSK